MLKKSILINLPVTSVLLLSGCMSSNVPPFNPDSLQAHEVANKLTTKVALGNFTMPNNLNKNHILCRLAGNIYLPNKMTYSSYIKHAFAEVLLSANRYSDHSKKHAISADIQKVDFDSVKGNWVIAANVKVNHNKPVSIYSKSEFGSSWSAFSACKNVASGFQTAVQQFANKALTNPSIVRQLNK